MKKVLILVLSCDLPPYRKMIETSQLTWDSFEVDGVETIYITGESKENSGSKEINLPIKESLYAMGEKAIQSFDYVLKNKEFDYVARVNSSCYVNKKELIKFVQTLPEKDLFMCAEVADKPYNWGWGGYQFIYSKDVIQKVVDNKQFWNHGTMEDKGVSCLINKLGIPYTQIKKSCSINKQDSGWLCLSCENNNFYFQNFDEVKNYANVFYRVKCDGNRSIDEIVMNELFNALNK